MEAGGLISLGNATIAISLNVELVLRHSSLLFPLI
jgi:hypothetical protein